MPSNKKEERKKKKVETGSFDLDFNFNLMCMCDVCPKLPHFLRERTPSLIFEAGSP